MIDMITPIQEMEAYAKEFNIPIMEQEGITFLCDFIHQHNIVNILEIGAAIGYSAIRMAQLHPNIHVTTIERDLIRYQEACKNISKMNMESQITIHHGDALEAVLEGEYDLIFIDAAKAQYIKFFERYTPYLRIGGYVLSDNLNFHGYVKHPETIESRDLRQMVRKIKNYITFLEEHVAFTTQFIELGDGVAVSQKMK